jgi:MoxR-like ATPase
MEGSKILEAQKYVRDVHINAELIEWVSDLGSRYTCLKKLTVKFVRDWVRWGAGPRAGQAMILHRKSARIIEEDLLLHRKTFVMWLTPCCAIAFS